MTPGLALFLTFTAIDVVLGVLATQLVGRLADGPRSLPAHILPVLAGFGALGLFGHSLGAHIGPTVPLYGFDVALLGDIAICFSAAVLAALAQAAAVRARRRSREA